jgi:hypothetical protein
LHLESKTIEITGIEITLVVTRGYVLDI